jgi:uncharacterized SAM-binding protein YcdF (DUF218 family)
MGLFVAGKVLGLLTQPLLWIAAMLALALLWQKRHPQRSRKTVTAALVLLLGLGWEPVPDLLMRSLEDQYTEMAPDADLGAYVGVIVLGGATESGHVARDHLQPLLNSAAERMTATVSVARRNPHLQVVFTGGEGALLGVGPSEAERARAFFDSLGLTGARIHFENISRNTHDNAILTAALPVIDTSQRWLLLTSAWHMPRSMATFQKVGWNVTAYPVDFRTGNTTPWTEYSLIDSITRWQLLLNELLGLLAYRITGRL